MKSDNNKLARKISQLILHMQIEFALLMSRITSGYSPGSLKAGLILCCLALSLLSTWFIMDAFKKKPAVKTVATTTIKFMPLLQKKEVPGIILTQDDYDKLQKFRHYMDSLRTHESGKIKYDSILKARQGLMDSIGILENIYLSRQKN